MKKLLIVLLLIFGFAATANADLIFTILKWNSGLGEYEWVEQEDEIWMWPSRDLVLGLNLASDENVLKYSLEYAINNEQAEFISDGAEFPWLSMFPGKVVIEDEDGVCEWVRIAADNFMQANAGPLVLMQGLIVHCLEETDVLLTVAVYGDTVIDGETVEVGTEMHTLLLKQIPEPATIALLGLGGLFLRRRR